MSKQSEAKAAHVYRHEVRRNCGNCEYRTYDERSVYVGMRYVTKITNNRCAVGGFPVKLTKTCDSWEAAT